MWSLVKLLVGSALALALLVPVGILLAVVGMPILLVVALLAIPAVLALAVVGLPLLLMVIGGAMVIAFAAAVISMVLGLAVLTAKVVFLVVLPIALVVWLARRIMAERDREQVYDWA